MADLAPDLVSLIKRGGNIVLTGEFEASDRAVALEIFEAAGLRVCGSVSTKTDFLIAAPMAKQNKIDRAKQLNIPVFTEREFWIAVDMLYPAE